MRRTRARNFRLGLFLVVAGALFAAAVVVLAGLALFDRRAKYHLYFDRSVSGLEVGAPVRVRGVRQGTVDAIGIDPETTQVHVVVEIDAETPLHTDAEAGLGYLGVTGLKYVEIGPGSPEMPRLPEGSRIQTDGGGLGAIAGDLEGLVGEAETLLANVNALIGPQNRDRLTEALDAATGTLRAMEGLMTDNRGQLNALVANAASTLQTIDRLGQAAVPVVEEAGTVLRRVDGTLAAVPAQRIGRRLDETVAAVHGIATDPELRDAARTLATSARDLAGRVDELDQGVERGVRETLALLATLQRAGRELELFLRQIRTQPSVLLRGRPEVEP